MTPVLLTTAGAIIGAIGISGYLLRRTRTNMDRPSLMFDELKASERFEMGALQLAALHDVLSVQTKKEFHHLLSDAAVLTSAHNWIATPWDYNSVRFLAFHDNGAAEVGYGYGQGIFAHVYCTFDIVPPRKLRFTYLCSPPVQLFRGFTPTEQNRHKEVAFTLIPGPVIGLHGGIGGPAKPYRFVWTLVLESSPYPDGLVLPFGVPLEFYGHDELRVPG